MRRLLETNANGPVVKATAMESMERIGEIQGINQKRKKLQEKGGTVWVGEE